MNKSFFNDKIKSEFHLADHTHLGEILFKEGSFLKFIWVTGGTLHLNIDGTDLQVKSNQILCSTYLQKIKIIKNSGSFYVLTFNREFYCIHTNDEEVSCNGLLFFGSNFTPLINLEGPEVIRLKTLIDVLEEEFDTVDINQEEMLRILLKRFIIRCTRLGREQLTRADITLSQLDIIRKFNALVEEHFRQQKQVSFYADQLNRSPKTLSNIFHRYNDKSALNVIFDRVILEAKRYLIYTDRSIKEIAGELGFEDPAHFSRFFKKQTGISSSGFRVKSAMG